MISYQNKKQQNTQTQTTEIKNHHPHQKIKKKKERMYYMTWEVTTTQTMKTHKHQKTMNTKPPSQRNREPEIQTKTPPITNTHSDPSHQMNLKKTS